MVRAIRLLAGLGVGLLAACAIDATVPDARQASPGVAAGTVAESGDTAANYPVRAFPAQTLAALLTAETAGIRGNILLALELYREQARVTRDPGVIARAAQIAEYAGDTGAMAELGVLWVAVEPEHQEAREFAAIGLAREGRVAEAIPHAAWLLERGSGQIIRELTARTARLPEAQRHQLLAAFDALGPRFPDDPDLLFGRALLRWQAGQVDEARALAARALALQPDNPAGQLLFAQLLDEAGLSDQALDHLEQLLPRYPDDVGLGRHYVRMLLERRDYGRAVARLTPLVAQLPDEAMLRFGLALAYRGDGRIGAAREQLELLTEDPEFRSDAHLQLGELAEADGQAERAIGHYRRVDGEHWLAATAKLTRLLTVSGRPGEAREYLRQMRHRRGEPAAALFQLEAELLMHQGRQQEAVEILDEGLEAMPDSIDLLYARSLAHEKLGDIAAVEADLRAILEQDADNAAALNALGYSLTNHTDRHEEAQQLIERALELAPDDAAIIDSLGWVLYRRGHYHRAIAELRRAAALMADPEVAAHLGEVLWVVGKREEARSIWAEALDTFPDDQLIRETMRRLQVDFTP